MDQNNSTPSFEIPKSVESKSAHTELTKKEPGSNSEFTVNSPEILPPPAGGSSNGGSVTGVTNLVNDNSAKPVSDDTQLVQSVVAQDDHLIADDVDIIEKEWVDRAKKILSLTADDPRLGTKEINKLKATYMKRRFDKDLVLPAE